MAAGRGLGSGLIESTVQQGGRGCMAGWAWIIMLFRKLKEEGRVSGSVGNAPPAGRRARV